MGQLMKHFTKNPIGRDWACGDIHGCFGLLKVHLADLQFDASRDRLFSVGDLVDRGPDSEEALDWLAKPWFHAVRGNHEQMAIDYVEDALYDERMYVANGGGWNVNQPVARRVVYADAFKALPLAIEVETADGLVGIVHADCPFDTWDAFRESMHKATPGIRLSDIENVVMWSRDRFNEDRTDGIPDLHALVVGHTPVRDGIKRLGNVFFIDTGAVFRGGHLTVVALDNLSVAAAKRK